MLLDPGSGREASFQRSLRNRNGKMPGSTLSVFSEPDDFQAALKEGGCVDLIVTGRGRFWARHSLIVLHCMRLAMGEERESRVAFFSVPPRFARVILPIEPGSSLICGGTTLQPGEIVTYSAGHGFHERTNGPCRWGTMLVLTKDLITFGRTMSGSRFALPPGECRWQPAPDTLRSLIDLHQDAFAATAACPRLPVRRSGRTRAGTTTAGSPDGVSGWGTRGSRQPGEAPACRNHDTVCGNGPELAGRITSLGRDPCHARSFRKNLTDVLSCAFGNGSQPVSLPPPDATGQSWAAKRGSYRDECGPNSPPSRLRQPRQLSQGLSCAFWRVAFGDTAAAHNPINLPRHCRSVTCGGLRGTNTVDPGWR